MSKGFVFIVLLCCLAIKINAQNYSAFGMVALHNPIAAASIKNTEKINNQGFMDNRSKFSLAQGTSVSLGFQSVYDSSDITLKLGVQRMWATGILAATNNSSGNQAAEVWNATQNNFIAGVGIKTKGKNAVEVIAGPLIPLSYNVMNTISYRDANEDFLAEYKVKFKNSLGLHFSSSFIFQVNEKVSFTLGAYAQLLKRNIASRTLSQIKYSKGDANSSNYAKTTYQNEQEFIAEVTPDINDSELNPKNWDANKPRQLLTQSYSFSSLALQFGLIYKW